MTGGADDYRFLTFGTERGNAGCRGVETEIDQHVSLVKYRAEIVALIHLSGYFEFGPLGSTRRNSQPHLALRTGDDYSDHRNTPHCFIVCRKVSRFFAEIGTSGKRNSSSIRPIMASAALTGPGLVSMNKSLNSR